MEEPQHQLHLRLKKTILSIDEEEELMAKPNYFSFSPTEPAETSPMIKQKSLSKMKKILAPKKGSKFKSKPKQVKKSQECGKPRRRKKRTRVEDLYNNDEAKLSVMKRVEEVLNSIADDYPSFVKCMLPSNVSHGFWLYLPMKFCNSYLPMHDSTVTLVGECGKEYETNYLFDRHGLSGGWRGFSLAQRILKGDLLVFQLIKPCTLKVNIVRVYGLDEVDAALCLMDLVSHADGTCPRKKTRAKRKAKNSVKPLVQGNTNENELTERLFKDGLIPDQAKTESSNLSSEVLEGSESSNELGSLVSSQPRITCSSFKAHNVASSRAFTSF